MKLFNETMPIRSNNGNGPIIRIIGYFFSFVVLALIIWATITASIDDQSTTDKSTTTTPIESFQTNQINQTNQTTTEKPCTRPTNENAVAYDFTNVQEKSLVPSQSFVVTNIKCASDYETIQSGITVIRCSKIGGEYKVQGCRPKTFVGVWPYLSLLFGVLNLFILHRIRKCYHKRRAAIDLEARSRYNQGGYNNAASHIQRATRGWSSRRSFTGNRNRNRNRNRDEDAMGVHIPIAYGTLETDRDMASRIQRGYRCVTARREVARRRGTLHVPDLPVSEEIPLATAVAVNESVNGNRRNVYVVEN